MRNNHHQQIIRIGCVIGNSLITYHVHYHVGKSGYSILTNFIKIIFLKIIQDYHAVWDEYDKTEDLEVKERHCKEVDRNKAIMEIKMEVISQVDEDMR